MTASPRPLLACLAIGIAAMSTSSLRADAAADAHNERYELRYKFKRGEVVRYNVAHRMSIRNTIDEKTQTARTKTDSTKVWKIIDVMPDGEIELINLVERVTMHNELPDKEAMHYDSDKDDTPPAGFADAAKAIGVPLSVVRMTPRGKIIQRDVKHHQPAADQDTPIAMLLPDEPVAIGDTWNEPLEVKVQLQEGGKKVIDTRRHFKLTDVKHGIASIDVSYQVLSPITPHIEAQIVQRLMKGSLKFDIEAGRVAAQQFDVDERVLGYAGPTSSMHYVAQMEEKLLSDPPEVASKP